MKDTNKDMKRVCCLYRVSSTQQVDVVKDDIPMQKQACHEFAARQGWIIVAEKYEKGVSGYKVSAQKRDAIQDIKEMALRHEFDVLLVFMFDRLGRIDSETPFVVQWFTEQGIELWSVNEGQQRLDSHTDRLINYIRFWQASGESQKISVRVKTRLEQMTSEGIYTGGVVPYGYRLVYRGRLNKKGQEMRDLEIDPEEADVVRLIFRKTVQEGYGSHMLASFLNKQGYTTHNHAPFQSNYVCRILKNALYRGYFEKGEARSERIEALQIISDADFYRAQDILKQRARQNDDKRHIAMTNRGKTLLSGNVYCAHCGCRLATTSHVERYHRRDGSLYEKENSLYICYHRSRGLNDCDGASTYLAEKIDAAVIRVMHSIFASMTGCPQEEKIEAAYKKMIAGNHQMQQKLNVDLRKNRQQLDCLRLEIGKALTGESAYGQEDLATAIEVLRQKISEAEEQLAALQQEEAEKKAMSENLIPAYKQFRSWAEEFDAATPATQKIIACQLFPRVEIGRNYQIRLVLDATYRQFCDEWLTPKTLSATA